MGKYLSAECKHMLRRSIAVLWLFHILPTFTMAAREAWQWENTQGRGEDR
jgi:hypothetical protein